MLLINKTEQLATVEIILANGSKDSVNVQPRSRVSLPPGSVPNPKKLAVYKQFIKFHAETSEEVESLDTGN